MEVRQSKEMSKTNQFSKEKKLGRNEVMEKNTIGKEIRKTKREIQRIEQTKRREAKYDR